MSFFLLSCRMTHYVGYSYISVVFSIYSGCCPRYSESHNTLFLELSANILTMKSHSVLIQTYAGLQHGINMT